MARKFRTDLARSQGWEATKNPATDEVFFLDFPLYRTYRAGSYGFAVGLNWEGNKVLLEATCDTLGICDLRGGTNVLSVGRTLLEAPELRRHVLDHPPI